MRIQPGTKALVTGASSGIGRALARLLAARGARLGLLARDAERLERLAAELPAQGEDHVVLAADVGKRGELSRAVERFARRAGSIELVVANAGVARYAPFPDQPVEDAEAMVRVNVLGTVYTLHAALPHLLRGGRGHVVVVSSGAGLRAFPSAAVYGGTKAFDRGFAEALRHELSGTGVGVTTVFPGEVETQLHAEAAQMPDWRRNDDELDPRVVAEAIVAAVEADRRAVYTPPIVRILGLNGIAPRVTDHLLARVRGPTAAPRRD